MRIGVHTNSSVSTTDVYFYLFPLQNNSNFHVNISKLLDIVMYRKNVLERG